MKNIATIDDESEVIPTDKGPFWTWIKVYVSLGFRVHPIQPEEKKPLLEDWPNKATTNLEQIEKWRQDYPGSNIGIVTGKPSIIFVLNVDDSAGALSLARLQAEYGALPETCKARTGIGRHYYFRYPEGLNRQIGSGNVAPGLDIRATGGYVVAPPSVHPSGYKYRWFTGLAPDRKNPTYAPQWLLEKIQSLGQTSHLDKQRKRRSDPSEQKLRFIRIRSREA